MPKSSKEITPNVRRDAQRAKRLLEHRLDDEIYNQVSAGRKVLRDEYFIALCSVLGNVRSKELDPDTLLTFTAVIWNPVTKLFDCSRVPDAWIRYFPQHPIDREYTRNLYRHHSSRYLRSHADSAIDAFEDYAKLKFPTDISFLAEVEEFSRQMRDYVTAPRTRHSIWWAVIRDLDAEGAVFNMDAEEFALYFARIQRWWRRDNPTHRHPRWYSSITE